MIIFSIIAFLSFIIGMGALLAILILGIMLGSILKKHDLKAYQGLYAFFMPFSSLLFGYVRSHTNLDKLPQNKQWILIALKYLLPTAFISGILMFTTGYIVFAD